jgi:hypothetical protein
MVCQQCGRAVEAGDRFCTGCGVSLTELPPVDAADPDGDDAAEDDRATRADANDAADTTSDVPPDATETAGAELAGDRTELVEVVIDDGWGETDPVWAPTAPTPRVTSASATDTADLPSTQPITEVRMARVDEAAAASPTTTPYDFVEREPTSRVDATAPMPAVVHAAPPPRRVRFTAVTVFGVFAGIVTLAASFTTIVAVESDVRLQRIPEAPAGFRTGTWLADDLAGNLSIAALIATLGLVVGAVAAAFRWRWGSGLAAGAGLAVAGLAALTVGLAQFPIDAAYEFADIPNDQQFVLTITRDLGYWLLIAAGALGVVVFFAAINDAAGDRSGLNPWIAALGGLATVVAVFGPLIPENLADWSDNWYVADTPGSPPALLLLGRLVQLGLLALAGLIGFLSVRRWGIGVAFGVSLPVLWLAFSTLLDLTDDPVGPGFQNPGADDMHLHGVTIIGMSALLAMAVLAAIAAYDQSVREGR